MRHIMRAGHLINLSDVIFMQFGTLIAGGVLKSQSASAYDCIIGAPDELSGHFFASANYVTAGGNAVLDIAMR